MIKIILINSSKVIYSFLGIVVVLTVVGYFETKRTRPLNSWIINISGSCMGVYLLHQFILKAVYDFTNMPYILGPYLLPWFSFILTLIGSLLLTKGIKNFKIGKYLIG
jgi:surface polysaccharide O-acyltransferase-like enzyme